MHDSDRGDGGGPSLSLCHGIVVDSVFRGRQFYDPEQVFRMGIGVARGRGRGRVGLVDGGRSVTVCVAINSR